jgi:hypothetical protein
MGVKMPQDKRYRCILGPLTLCVRFKSPKSLDLRVVHRSTASPFQHALTIRPGTVLRLFRKREEAQFVKAKVFNPRIQYGRFVAGGVLEIF